MINSYYCDSKSILSDLHVVNIVPGSQSSGSISKEILNHPQKRKKCSKSQKLILLKKRNIDAKKIRSRLTIIVISEVYTLY